MSVIEQAQAHFEAASLDIEVPEWDCVIHASPFTLGERKIASKRAGGDAQTLYAEILILKARDENGEPMFTRNDKMALMKQVDGSVVERIATTMFGETSVGDAEKN